jgi:TolB protein
MLTRIFPQFKSFSLIVVTALAVVALSQTEARAQRDMGTVDLKYDLKNIPIFVTGATPELNALANQAFNAHGAFRRQTQNPTFTVAFAPGDSRTTVKVTVTRAATAVVVERAGKPTAAAGATAPTAPGAVILSETVVGTSPRNALFKAADLAVRAMTGKRGFFASRLAFIEERAGKQEVYVGDLFLGDSRALTKDRALAMSPRWSPDGSRLLYTSFFRTGFPDIFVLDLNSLQRNTFVSFKGTNSGARFSPDGSKVAMVLSGDGNPEIYVSNSQGRAIARKTRTRSVEAGPCFSPDGSQFVFTSDAAGGPQLYLMATAGGEARRVPTRISGYCAEPDWSKADPTKIVFTAGVAKGFKIAVHDLGTGVAKIVPNQPAGDAVEPSWLADGRHVVFSSRSAGTSSLWILDTVNGKATQLSLVSAGKVSQASVLDPR